MDFSTIFFKIKQACLFIIIFDFVLMKFLEAFVMPVPWYFSLAHLPFYGEAMLKLKHPGTDDTRFHEFLY